MLLPRKNGKHQKLLNLIGQFLWCEVAYEQIENGCHRWHDPDQWRNLRKRGLPWLQRVKQETGMRVATEVATAKHVEEVLKHDIDLLWIGARTSANPFAVQEIADTLNSRPEKNDIFVFVSILNCLKDVRVLILYFVSFLCGSVFLLSNRFIDFLKDILH